MRSVFHVAVAAVVAMGCEPAAHGPAADSSLRLRSAIDAATRTNQPLIVELGATWCKPCHEFADHVLTDPRVQAALRDIVFVQYDIDTPNGTEAMRRCNVTGVPAVVGVDRDGTVQPVTIGTVPTADELLAFVRRAKAKLAPAP